MVTEVPGKVELLRKSVLRVESLLERVAESMGVFARAMEQHVALIESIKGVVDELGRAVAELRLSVRELRELLGEPRCRR